MVIVFNNYEIFCGCSSISFLRIVNVLAIISTTFCYQEWFLQITLSCVCHMNNHLQQWQLMDTVLQYDQMKVEHYDLHVENKKQFAPVLKPVMHECNVTLYTLNRGKLMILFPWFLFWFFSSSSFLGFFSDSSSSASFLLASWLCIPRVPKCVLKCHNQVWCNTSQ